MLRPQEDGRVGRNVSVRVGSEKSPVTLMILFTVDEDMVAGVWAKIHGFLYIA